MRTKRRRMMLQTTVTIFLSINVHMTRDRTNRLLTIPILPLTTLLAWSWSLMDAAIRLLEQIDRKPNGFQQGLSVGLILLVIGCRSVLYGAGVRL